MEARALVAGGGGGVTKEGRRNPPCCRPPRPRPRFPRGFAAALRNPWLPFGPCQRALALKDPRPRYSTHQETGKGREQRGNVPCLVRTARAVQATARRCTVLGNLQGHISVSECPLRLDFPQILESCPSPQTPPRRLPSVILALPPRSFRGWQRTTCPVPPGAPGPDLLTGQLSS
jgi:hypothetical protein